MLHTHYALCTANEVWKVSNCENWNVVSVHINNQLQPIFIFFLLVLKNGHTFGSFSINLHAFQPWSYSCLQSIFTHCTHSSLDAKLCMPSLCHLFVDCWHVVCFCFSFQFFHAQYYTEEVLCIPCQFQYVLPAHSRLAFILYLASLLFFSSSFSFSCHFVLVLVALSRHISVAKGLLDDCFPMPPVWILRLLELSSRLSQISSCLYQDGTKLNCHALSLSI